MSSPPQLAPHPQEKERKDFLTDFESKWKAPKLLRTHSKRILKEYYSKKQGRDGTRALCYLCNIEFGIDSLQIHHLDHDRTNNQLSNISPACGPCNNDERSNWLAASYAEHASVITPREKENAQIAEMDQERLKKQAPLTTQLKIMYKRETLEYLIQYVTDEKDFDQVVADVEARSNCSHQKAIEYVDSYSRSSFSPWRQWTNLTLGQRIARRPGWDAAKYATPEYKAALANVQRRQREAQNQG